MEILEASDLMGSYHAAAEWGGCEAGCCPATREHRVRRIDEYLEKLSAIVSCLDVTLRRLDQVPNYGIDRQQKDCLGKFRDADRSARRQGRTGAHEYESAGRVPHVRALGEGRRGTPAEGDLGHGDDTGQAAHPAAEIDRALDTAAIARRFADNGLIRILVHQVGRARTEPSRAGEAHSLQLGRQPGRTFGVTSVEDRGEA